MTIFGDSFQCVMDLTVECTNSTPNAVDACDSALINGTWYSETQVIYDTLVGDSIVITDLTIEDCSVNQYCEIDLFSGGNGDKLGISSDIQNNWAIAGSYLDDNANGTDAGSATIYQKVGSNWVLDQVLLAVMVLRQITLVGM